MREVAARAGVSGKTVSRVINGDRYVSADVRQRVQQAIADLSYVPNMLSQVFRSGRDTAIGLAVPDIADGFFAAVIHEVESVARARGTAVLVTSVGQHPADEQPAVEALLHRSIAGLVLAPVAADQSYLQPWMGATRVVFVDRPPQGVSADSVVEDDIGGAAAAVAYLVSLGHRRIAFVGNADAVVTTNRRLLGYRRALAAARVAADPAWELHYSGDTAAVVAGLLDLLSRNEVSAVFSSNSQSSTALVPAIRRAYGTGPGVVSFGDFPMADALQPPVSVVRQDPAAIGRLAAERLFAQVDDGATAEPEALTLPVPLVVRDRGSPDPQHGTDPAAPTAPPVSRTTTPFVPSREKTA